MKAIDTNSQLDPDSHIFFMESIPLHSTIPLRDFMCLRQTGSRIIIMVARNSVNRYRKTTQY